MRRTFTGVLTPANGLSPNSSLSCRFPVPGLYVVVQFEATAP
jgi:hypothetical protein